MGWDCTLWVKYDIYDCLIYYLFSESASFDVTLLLSLKCWSEHSILVTRELLLLMRSISSSSVTGSSLHFVTLLPGGSWLNLGLFLPPWFTVERVIIGLIYSFDDVVICAFVWCKAFIVLARCSYRYHCYVRHHAAVCTDYWTVENSFVCHSTAPLTIKTCHLFFTIIQFPYLLVPVYTLYQCKQERILYNHFVCFCGHQCTCSIMEMVCRTKRLWIRLWISGLHNVACIVQCVGYAAYSRTV